MILAHVQHPGCSFGTSQGPVEADPTSSYHRLVMARIARDLGRLEDAIAIAESALAAADDDGERTRAQEYLDWLRRARQALPR